MFVPCQPSPYVSVATICSLLLPDEHTSGVGAGVGDAVVHVHPEVVHVADEVPVLQAVSLHTESTTPHPDVAAHDSREVA